MGIQRSKIKGVICENFKASLDLFTDLPSQLSLEIYNNGFDGEKHESVISFRCKDKNLERYKDIALSIFIDEAEIIRVIKTLKSHLKKNRKQKS